MADSLALLELDEVAEHRYRLPMPAGSQEGGHVVFGGQLMAQSIMAAVTDLGDGKYVKSLHTIFSRAGTYESPIELQVEPFQTGRTWASQLVTAWQGERLLTRSIALLTADEPDLIAHHLAAPSGVSGPSDGGAAAGIVFPGAESRAAQLSDETVNGVRAMCFWTRMPGPVGAGAASQAVLSWATNGSLIGLNMQAHPDEVRIEDTHKTLSTGVIGHTINFHRDFDASSWLLVSHEGTFAGKGRVHGRGAVFTEDGDLVATFSQDSMVKPRNPSSGAL